MKRRDFVVRAGVAGLGLSVLGLTACGNKEPEPKGEEQTEDTSSSSAIVQPELGYAFDALAPHIDARTMEIHYTKHHAGYVRKLNNALEGHRLQGQSLEDIIAQVSDSEADTAVLNNAGGTANHNLYWDILTPGYADTQPSDEALLAKLTEDFGSFEAFTNGFSQAASTVFGSGWAWLILQDDNKLAITTTENQNNPLMRKVEEVNGTPVLGIDVWEHAYYLKYQNRRGEYIEQFMQAINWDKVASRYQALV